MHLKHEAFFVTFSAGWGPAILALALGLTAGEARAGDEKDICVRAVERAQLVRLDGKLREAREGFVTCARAVCPEAIRQDCTRWVTEVDASLPSVVFDAVWADGRDVTRMTVLLDGEVLAGAERGRAVSLDPGAHTFRFEVAGAAPVEMRNVIREGEKNRILRAMFSPTASLEATTPAGPAPAPVLAPAPAPTTPSTAAPSGLWQPLSHDAAGPMPTKKGPIPLGAFILGGIALAGFGGFAYLGLSGTGRLDSMRSSCGHACNPSDVTSARDQILVGDILAYVGLAAAGAAVFLTLARPDVPVAASMR
jgi:hypothetical protein